MPLLTLTEVLLLFKHKEIEYDCETAAQIMRDRGFEGCEQIADQLLVPVLRHL